MFDSAIRDAMAEIEDAAAFDKARVDGSLYIGQESVAWFEARGGLRAILPVDGMPTGADVRIVMQLTTHLTPQNLSILWNDTRVRGMDFVGFAHQNARGQRIPTPHCQFFRPDGVRETEPLDVAQIGSMNCESALRNALETLMTTDIECRREGDRMLLETPYPAGRGYFLQVYVTVSDRGIAVSDGGFTTSQVEMYVRSRVALKHRYRDLQAIAQKLGIMWDGDFSYTDETIEDAVRRLTVLAQAVQEGQELASSRGLRLSNVATERLLDELEKRGVKVQENVRIALPGQKRAIIVDLEVERKERKAAVEVLSATSTNGAANQIDHLVTNFYVLDKSGYEGLLFGVYNEHGPFRDDRYRERFEIAKPSNAWLIPEAKATEEIIKRLDDAA